MYFIIIAIRQQQKSQISEAQLVSANWGIRLFLLALTSTYAINKTVMETSKYSKWMWNYKFQLVDMIRNLDESKKKNSL